jgi:hypothetical protein
VERAEVEHPGVAGVHRLQRGQPSGDSGNSVGMT